MSLFSVLKRMMCGWGALCIKNHSLFFLSTFYKNDIWLLRASCNRKRTKLKEMLYYAYLQRFGAWIGLNANFEGIPTFPHSFYGIFISHNAHIGKNAVIFHQVTIGSNTLKDSKKYGSPTIGDNCYIGCGAKIIGGVSIGDNVRIGANCIITQDIPDNSVCVFRGLEIIQKNKKLDNVWVGVYES